MTRAMMKQNPPKPSFLGLKNDMHTVIMFLSFQSLSLYDPNFLVQFYLVYYPNFLLKMMYYMFFKIFVVSVFMKC